MGAVFAFVDLGACGLPLPVGGPFPGGVAAFEGVGGVEGEDVGAGVAVAGGGVAAQRRSPRSWVCHGMAHWPWDPAWIM